MTIRLIGMLSSGAAVALVLLLGMADSADARQGRGVAAGRNGGAFSTVGPKGTGAPKVSKATKATKTKSGQ